MTQARTPEEKIDQLLTLRSKVEAEIRHALAQINCQPLRRRSRYVVPECGTESAFQRHHYRGEDVDQECREAHRLYERVRYARVTYGATC